jgi:hypothetical protein
LSLAESLKKSSCVGVSLQKDSVVLKNRFKSKAPMVTCQKIDIRGIRNLARDQVLGTAGRSILRKTRHSPYCHRRSNVEVRLYAHCVCVCVVIFSEPTVGYSSSEEQLWLRGNGCGH